VPNRTRKHPNRKPPQSVPGLIRTGLRVPTRQGLKLTRPTKTKAKTARRSLTRLAARGAGKATRRASSWSWASIRAWFAKLDTRARGLTAPIPLPEGTIVIPAIPPRTEKDIRRKYSNTAKARQPVRIKLTGRRAVTQPTQNGTTITMNPTQSVIEAFTQLAQFEPENATAILELIDALPDMWQEVAAALNAQAQNFSSTQPI
jgi:hypothetical protein